MTSLLILDDATEGVVGGDGKEEAVISNFENLPGEEITYGGVPTQEMWALPPIRKSSQTGGTLVWQISFDPANNQLIRRRGYEVTPSGGAGSISDDTVSIETNQSSRTLQQQALLEAKKRFLDKSREGYGFGEVSPEHLLPAQLACTYWPPHATEDKKSNERAIDAKEFERCPLACQVKVDGIRARTFRNQQGEIEMISRENRAIEWHEHIRAELSDFFLYLPEGVALDGELKGSRNFEDTQSKIMQQHQAHPDNEDIKFHIFDLIISETILEDRIVILAEAAGKYSRDHDPQHIEFLSHTYAKSHHDIDQLLYESLAKGYEGVMIRFFAGPNPTKRQIERSWYKGRRNVNLLKYKTFLDEEGIIEDVIEGKDRNAGAAIFVLRDPRGKIFKCVPHGGLEYLREIYANRENYIGREYTYKYQNLGKNGRPRFPIGMRFRDYESAPPTKAARG